MERNVERPCVFIAAQRIIVRIVEQESLAVNIGLDVFRSPFKGIDMEFIHDAGNFSCSCLLGVDCVVICLAVD